MLFLPGAMWCAIDNDEEEPAIQEGLDAEDMGVSLMMV